MTANTLMLLKWALGGLAALFGILAGIFAVMAALKDRDELRREWFRKRWETIQKSRWTTLPEKASDALRQGRMILSGALLRTITTYKILIQGFAIFAAILLPIVAWLRMGWVVGVLSIPIAFFMIHFDPTPALYEAHHGGQVSAFFIRVAVAIVCAPLLILLWTLVMLRSSIYFATPTAILLTPFYWVVAVLPTNLAVARDGFRSYSVLRAGLAVGRSLGISSDKVLLLSLGVAGSFSMTLTALLIGHIVDPGAPVPQTMQMLLANIICDGLTVLITFTVLDAGLKSGKAYALPAAVLIDALASGLLACASLYLALVLTDTALSTKEVLHTLIGRSLDGTHLEFSPYFWTMHTTFIPILLYLCFILFCWTAKAFLQPVRWFLGKGKELSSPLNLSAALCVLIAAVFGALAYATGTWQEYADRHQNPAESPPAVSMIYRPIQPPKKIGNEKKSCLPPDTAFKAPAPLTPRQPRAYCSTPLSRLVCLL
jgi:hypothetical protein